MNKEEDLKKEIEKIKSIAFKNGWKIGKHLFNYLNEIQMFQYDNIKYEIDRLEAEQIFLEMIKKSPIKERIDKEFRKHKTLDWSKIAEIKIKSEIKSKINSSQHSNSRTEELQSVSDIGGDKCEEPAFPANKEPEDTKYTAVKSSKSSGSDNQKGCGVYVIGKKVLVDGDYERNNHSCGKSGYLCPKCKKKLEKKDE